VGWPPFFSSSFFFSRLPMETGLLIVIAKHYTKLM
jgi:hypothetical protein